MSKPVGKLCGMRASKKPVTASSRLYCVLSTISVAVAVTACGLIVHPEHQSPPALSGPAPNPLPSERHFDGKPFSLRGDADFSPGDLDADQRVWFDRTWTAIANSSSNANSWASSGNLYDYGRQLNLYVHQLLTGLRATGDLRFLDEAERLSRLMEAELTDEWLDGTKDGYRGWLYLRNSTTHYGKDLHVMDEMLTHSGVAAIMYALYINRDLPSPSGIDYGVRADFWYDYLKNDFEAKWRDRRNTPTGFPFLERDLTHPTAQWIRYHHYMGLRSGDDGYTKEAQRLAAIIDRVLVPTSTPKGDAFVWCHRPSNDCLYAQPTNYARYTINAIVDMTWEGLFTEHDLAKLATTVSHFVIDNGIDGLAPDVHGGETWNGYEPYTTNRQPITRLAPLAVLISYNPSHELERTVLDAYRAIESNTDKPRNIAIPTAMLLHLSPAGKDLEATLANAAN